MSHLLVTNDDGAGSPAVAPLIEALGSLGSVLAVVPDRERSWIAKAITRHDPVEVREIDIDGSAVHTTTGYPADCAQLGIHALADHPPRMVVSGINVGYNHGAAYLLSSGTVGAAVEAWIAGVPAVAVSAGTNGGWEAWAAHARSPASRPMWERLATVTADIVETLLDHGPSRDFDIVSINLPDSATLETPRRVCAIASVGYDRLFRESGPGIFTHAYGGGLIHFEAVEGTDVAVAADGEVAITPIRLPREAPIDGVLRAALERRARERGSIASE